MESTKMLNGRDVAAERVRCGLTQAELGELMNMSQSAVSMMERGEVEASQDFYHAILTRIEEERRRRQEAAK